MKRRSYTVVLSLVISRLMNYDKTISKQVEMLTELN